MMQNLRERTGMSSTLREIQDVFARSVFQPRFWGIFVSIIVMFALVGPFGTFDRMSLPFRSLYWSVTMLGSWLIAMSVIAIVFGLLHARYGNSFWVMILATALAAFPITVFLQLTIPLFTSSEPQVSFWQQFAYTLPITVIFGILVNFALRDVFEGGSEAGASDDNPLINRLPVGIRGPVKHMSMQDHYIQVTTTRGREMVLMRMADAVAALGAANGLQVHRSHWVSKEFVRDARRENGQPFVVMDDGAEYPVSRSYVKAAREAGVI